MLALACLLCLGRHTITGLLTTAGQQLRDWTASYRFFSQGRFDLPALFAPARKAVVDSIGRHDPLVVAMDDTLIGKRGHKVHGVKWLRDPLGPRFHLNLLLSLRFLQLSAILPEGPKPCRARAIPISITHCPLPKKPGKKATQEEIEHYKRALKQMKLTSRGLEAVTSLRRQMDEEGEKLRTLVITTDGSFTNSSLIKGIPERTVLAGRIRKDAALFQPPSGEQGWRGRRRIYGERLPTPEQIRQDDEIPWQSVEVYAAGKIHEFKVKSVSPVRMKGAGSKDIRMVVVSPLGYRKNKGGRMLYREPGYFICTDPEMKVKDVLQDYVWRWEIEQNFRDEKTLIGAGEAQVRTPKGVEQAVGFMVAVYSYLLLALHRYGRDNPIRKPKWRKQTKGERISTQTAISLMRAERLGGGLGFDNFEDFYKRLSCDERTPSKMVIDPQSAIICASQ